MPIYYSSSGEKQLMLSAETSDMLRAFLLGYIEGSGRICDDSTLLWNKFGQSPHGSAECYA